MKHYLIYQIRNKLNGMIYIGQHQTENVDDGYMGSGLRIQHAIKKYGVENFEKTILFDFDNFEEMNAKEAEIVNEAFIARDDVYNIILGGFGNWTRINDLKLNMSGSWQSIGQHCKDIYDHTGKWPNEDWLRKLKSANPQQYVDFCKKVSNGVKKQIKEHGSWWTGKHHSEETKQKMKDFHAKNHPQAGEKNSQYGKIAIYNEETFERAIQPKDQPIPNGWAKGRFYSISPEELKERKKLVEEILKLDSNSKATLRMKTQDLQKIYEKISNPKSFLKEEKLNKKEKSNLELRRIQKKQLSKEKIELLTKEYKFYREYGWNEFIKKFNYQYSRPNFIQQCKKYVKDFVSQNKKKNT